MLIALNPFQPVPLYSQDQMESYRIEQVQALPPHVYSIGNKNVYINTFQYFNAFLGNNALKNLNKTKNGQCIVITGVSGAGKTVTTNSLIEFLCGNSIERAAQAGIILEAFGNCQTPHNNNSSRFIKFVKVSMYFLLYSLGN